MKKLFLVTVSLLTFYVQAQISVYDCNALNSVVTQSDVQAGGYEFHRTCVEFSGQTYNFPAATDKKVTASTSITIKEDFHAGPTDPGAAMWFKIEEKGLYDVAVMNYPDLNCIQKLKKVEFGIDLEGDIEDRVNDYLANPYPPSTMNEVYKINPFLDWDLDIDAVFTHVQTGTVKKRDFFYFHEYERMANDWDDAINDNNDHLMRVRFAPPLEGLWVVTITVKVKEVLIAELPSFNFNVCDNNHPGYVYVHANKKNLKRGSKLIFPVGHVFPGPYKLNNIWYDPNNIPDINKTAGMDSWALFHSDVEEYVAMGGRYIKTVETAYGSLLEFAELGNYYSRMHSAWEKDQFMNFCEDNDVMIHFNLLFQDPISKFGEPRWDYGPYKVDGTIDLANNLPNYAYYVNDTKPSNMFADDALMNYHKQRTRYYVARYGYSPQIYTWEIISEPWHLDEITDPVNGSIIPALFNNSEQGYTVDMIDKYHNDISNYIKDELGDTDHLITIQQYYQGNDFNDPKFFNSAKNENVDIIGWNIYDDRPDELVIEKLGFGGNNFVHPFEETTYKKINYTQIQTDLDKPIFATELGSFYNQPCSFFLLHYNDIMTHGFSGLGGICAWHGFAISNGLIVNGIPWDEKNLWPSTIRTQNHMDGQDVTNVLDRWSGEWEQGRQEAKIWDYEIAPSKELQYYVAQDNADAVGYIMNRSYNLYTAGVGCPSGVSIEITNLVPFNIAWNDGPNSNALYIEGLQHKEWYRTDYYDYVNGETLGDYLSTTCEKTDSDGKLKLKKHPDLTIGSGNDALRPIVWFVTTKASCNKMMESDSSIISDSRELLNEFDESGIETTIYPNPFHSEVTILSQIKDEYSISTIEGFLIFERHVQIGENTLSELVLKPGVYFFKSRNTGKTFKLTKI